MPEVKPPEPIRFFHVVSLKDATHSSHNLQSLANMLIGHSHVEGDVNNVNEHYAIFTDELEAKSFAIYRSLLAKATDKLGRLSPVDLAAFVEGGG